MVARGEVYGAASLETSRPGMGPRRVACPRGAVTDSRGKGAAVDVVVVTPEEVTLYRDSPYLIIQPALSEGKVVFGV
jgi:hypothetical protein